MLSFKPTFIGEPTVSLPGAPLVNLRDMWFATQETAEELARRFGAKAVQLPAFFDQVWLRTSFAPPTQWYLNWADGTTVNAGFLADYFRRLPEDLFPGLAEKYVNQIIEGERQAQRH